VIAFKLAFRWRVLNRKIDATEPHEGDAFLEPIAVARSLEQEYLLLNV
jgi:hypothetical protein